MRALIILAILLSPKLRANSNYDTFLKGLTHTPVNGAMVDFAVVKNELESQDDLFGDITGLSVHVGPLVYGMYGKFKQIINKEVSTGSNLEIEQASEQSPYMMIEGRRWDLGAGLELYDYVPLHLGVLGLKVAFLKGKNYHSIRQFKNRAEIRTDLQLPLTLEAINEWRIGDQIHYSTRGGVVFNLFVGPRPFLGVGPEYIHSGSYRIRIQRLSVDLMEIELATTQTDSIGFEAINTFSKLQLSKGQGHLESIIYHFDLNHPQSHVAMAHLLHGRPDLTNREMLNSSGSISVSSSIEHNYGTLYGRYGIPFVLNFNSNRASASSNGYIEKEKDGVLKRLEIFTSSSLKESFTRGLLANPKWNTEIVASTIIRDQTGDHSAVSSLYSWSFSKTKMTKGLLLKQLKKVGKIFKSSKLEQLKLPLKKLGYLKAEINIFFSTADLLHLLNHQKLEVIKTKALSKIKSDFNSLGHRSFCKIKNYNDCLNKHVKAIKDKHAKIKKNVLKIQEMYDQDEMDEVTKRFTKMVKTLLTSRYLTSAFADGRPALRLELHLEGEKIKKHVIKL